MPHYKNAFDNVYWLDAQTDGRATYIAARLVYWQKDRFVDWKEDGVEGFDAFNVSDRNGRAKELKAKGRVVRRWKETALDLARVMAKSGLERESYIDIDDFGKFINNNGAL